MNDQAQYRRDKEDSVDDVLKDGIMTIVLLPLALYYRAFVASLYIQLAGISVTALQVFCFLSAYLITLKFNLNKKDEEQDSALTLTWKSVLVTSYFWLLYVVTSWLN